MNAFLRGSVMLDLEGSVLNSDDKRRLAHPLTGAVILFSRNFQSRQQLMELVRECRSIKPELLIAVDHEGGRVQRFKTDGFTHLPAMAQLGKIWHKKSRDSAPQLEAMRTASAIGYVLAAELRACDIDLSFTPVLDLDWGRSEVIGNRAFDADARTVTLLAKQLCYGLALAGMKSCGKHFPGHGWAEADSHVDLPVDERPLKTLLTHDAAPYAWFGLGLDAVMPAHVIYPKVDSVPAGFSKKWIQDILRGQLGFRGAVFSDDLAMAGARVAGNVVQSAHAALNAGCDMVLICNQPQQADALLDGLCLDAGAFSAKRLDALMPTTPALSWQQLREEERYLQARELIQNIQL
jgi:beta-N-acetylhexosaminidase